MAKGNGNLLLQGISGSLGKQYVIKHYGNKTVITVYPGMRKTKPTEFKKIYEGRFKEANQYARTILSDNDLKKQYESKPDPGQRVYNYAISEYLPKATLQSNSNHK